MCVGILITMFFSLYILVDLCVSFSVSVDNSIADLQNRSIFLLFFLIIFFPFFINCFCQLYTDPLQSAAWKSAPALACGNSIVFKPAENTPLLALALAEIYTEAGIPDGCFNVVLGDGSTGAHLSSHPDIAKVSFTGSVETGTAVYQSAASSMKSVTMELGGKSPLIIMEDAHLENAVSAAMMANWYSNGEVCSNGTRVFVHSDLMDSFLTRLIERTKKLRIGNPFDPDTDVGALITPEHLNRVMNYVRLNKKKI